jgi:membrane protease YdiL (CAAX protease family)
VRLSSEEPPTERETEAAARFADKSCRPPLAAFYPGLGHLSCGKPAEGKALVAAGTVELAGALAGAIGRGPDSAAAQLPLLAFSDLLVASTFDLILDSQRAERLVYTPAEDLPGLFAAPFDPQVLRDPMVWGGIAGTLAAGLFVSRVVDGPLNTDGFGQEPILFGARMHDSVGYPLAGALGTALFVQVAAAEEMAFRGVLQSGWARTSGETAGWVYASLSFGLVHASNLPFIERGARLKYLYAGVPFITLLGSYLGLAYRYGGYRLSKPVAVHFWYDFLLEAIGFAGDPKHSPLSAGIGMRF